MKQAIFFTSFLICTVLQACSQSNQDASRGVKVGGSCEGCEAIYESPTAFDKLTSRAFLPDWDEKGTRLTVSGTVYKSDGKTPATGVIIYVYHTDQTGVYPTRGDEKGWAKRHGYLRGWMKTDEKGNYRFNTLRPAAYPRRKDPAHIHVTIREPDKNEYWIDEFLFDDDPLLTESQRKKCENRGGDGILQFDPNSPAAGPIKAERNIYLGKNIPNYPK